MDGFSCLASADQAPFSGGPPSRPLVQHTMAGTAVCEGVGVHSGAPARLRLEPAPAGSGIVFIRTDCPLDQSAIPARYDLVSDTRLCTALSNEHGVSVATVEHLMAALAGCGVDNARVLIDGPEIPIMDGSSDPFVTMIRQAGTEPQTEKRNYIRVIKTVRVGDGSKWASLSPADTSTFAMEIDFPSRVIGQQARNFTLVNGNFMHELAGARTFGFLHEVEQLRALGLGKGGSLDNAIIIDGDSVLNDSGLRYDDEFVRHKLLDAVGDLALAGAPIRGAFHSARGGHALNNQLLRALFANPESWERL